MVFARFLPRDEQFFKFFDDAISNAKEMAQALVDILDNFDSDLERKVRRVRELEHYGDEIAHQVFQALNSTFVTPLDREDIRALISELDDFVDYIEEAIRRIWLYRIDQPTDLSKTFGRIIVEQAEILGVAIPLLEHSKKYDEIRRYIVEVNRLENEADEVLSHAMSALYDGATDIPTLIKAIRWGELYQLLEDATDRAEDVANALEAIILKYA